jgi:lysozyme
LSSSEIEQLTDALQKRNGSGTKSPESPAASTTPAAPTNGAITNGSATGGTTLGQPQQISPDCMTLIKEFEGYHTALPDGSAEAYRDPVGIWTIGWGSIRNLDENRPVRAGDRITQATATRWLQAEIAEKASVVQELCTVPITQSMFDALVSFGYNVGTGGGGLRTSTLLKKLNTRDYEGAVREFGRWVHGEVNGAKVELPGLVRRRKAEAALFQKNGLGDDEHLVVKSDSRPTEERDYQPAPLPLPFKRILQEGLEGNDCFLLNCALAGLGFLRVGAQPTQFTAVTKSAVELFQRREKISVNGQVGPTTQQALERALEDARRRIPQSSPDLVFCKLTKTGQSAYEGLEWCLLEFVSPQGQVLDTLRVISGAPGVQRFNLPANSDAGSGEPIPQGRYGIGDIDWANGKDNYNASHGEGLGPMWVPLTKKQSDDRDAFGMHGDWNWITDRRNPGSAGCVVPSTLEDLKELVRLLRKHDPRELVVYWGL